MTTSTPDWPSPTRSEILGWAKNAGNEKLLPLLVRRLILETNPTVKHIHFPGEGGVTEGGFDGILKAGKASAFVPAGTSVWELSVERGSAAKAEDDYSKRLTAPRGLPTTQVHYTALIAQPWTKSDDFIANHKSDERWATLSAMNIDDLQTWLSLAPGTCAWFAELRGVPIAGLQTASNWWDAWKTSTTIPLGREVVLAGREDEAEQLRSRMHKPGLILLNSDDLPIDEMKAFVSACTERSEDTQDGNAFPVVFVGDLQVFRRLSKSKTPLTVFVPDASWATDAHGGSSMCIIAPALQRSDAAIFVPRLDSQAVASRLQGPGATWRRSQELGQLGRRSLPALRRELAVEPALHFPQWAADKTVTFIRRAVLLSSWNEHQPADRTAAETFLGASGAALDDQLTDLLHLPESPISRVSGIWHIVSPTDSLALVAPRLTLHDLEAFKQLAVSVLIEADPALELEPQERWKAGILGKRRQFSLSIRSAVAATIARLAITDAGIRTGPAASTGQEWANLIISTALAHAVEDKSGRVWASLAPLAPTLAEASPTVFLDALNRATRDETFATAAFSDGIDGLFGPPPSMHTDLVRALETVAWSPDYFAKGVVLLARLTSLDPGGKWADRPGEVLARILNPYNPGTSADSTLRNAMLDDLRRKDPALSWRLMIRMLPSNQSGVSIHDGPRYRNWKTPPPPRTWGDYYAEIKSVLERLITDAATDGQRWLDLTASIARLDPGNRTVLADALARISGSLAGPGRQAIWESLRSEVAKHREYADAEWSLAETELSKLEEAMEAFKPSTPEGRYRWMFVNELIDLGDIRRREDYEEYEKAVSEARADAAGEIFSAGGVQALIAFAESTERPRIVGRAAAFGDIELLGIEDVSKCLAANESTINDFGQSYAAQRFQSFGWGWLDRLLERTGKMAAEAHSRALHATTDLNGALRRLTSCSDEVQQAFWRSFEYVGLGRVTDMLRPVANGLLSVGRASAAIKFLGIYSGGHVPGDIAEVAAEAFEELMGSANTDPEFPALSSWEFSELLKLLASQQDTLGRARVLAIEWFFLPTREHGDDPVVLHAALGDDPSFFVDIIRISLHGNVSTAKTELESENANNARTAQNAYSLLRSWKSAPGKLTNGRQDEDPLRHWIDEVLQLLKDETDVTVRQQAMFHIGTMLANTGNEDGSWPAPIVCALIEDLDDDSVDAGMSTQLFNRRGFFSKEMLAGGEQERDIADGFRALAEKSRRWPRTASIFTNLAADYSTYARQNDQTSELRQRGLSG